VPEQLDERREALASLSSKGATTDESVFSRLRMIDPVLLVATLGLCGFGVLAVAVAGEEDRQFYVSNQVVGLIIEGLIAAALTLFDYRWLERYLPWVYGAAIFMLLAVLAVEG
jgi:rod shape determining protein RodA